MKIYKDEFYKILNLVSSNEPFAFSRFSDGEVTILRNQKLVLGDGFFVQGDIYGQNPYNVPQGTYPPEERKEFIPEEDSLIHNTLMDSFKFKKKNYIKGIPGQNSYDKNQSWQFCIDLHGSKDYSDLSFSNVLINDNYRFFISKMVPIFKSKDIVLVSNENSDLSGLPFKVKKHFTIGPNCIKNNYGLIDTMKIWASENKIKNHLFLFAASSLSNFLIYELYKNFDENQYMDIGSSLGPYLKLEGWKGTRTYLNTYWSNPENPTRQEMDIWN